MVTATSMIVGLQGTSLLPEEIAFLARHQPLGVILFARNVSEPEQTMDLVASIKQLLRHEAMILIDQEGGRVARLRPPHWPVFPAGREFGALYERNLVAGKRALFLCYRLQAHYLNELGVNVDCAPVLDLLLPETHDVIGDRAYSCEPEPVAELGAVVAEALLAGGVLPIMKHIPGHGRAVLDSHKALPVVGASYDELLQGDVVPFRIRNDIVMAMTAHIVYTALDVDACATLSPIVIRFIRQVIGFDGLLMTDDLSMQALAGSFEGRSRRALAAGCDVVLHCNGDMSEMQAVARAVGELSGAGQRRVAAAFAALPREVMALDVAAAHDEMAALLAA